MINQPEPSADQAAEIRAAAFKTAALFVRGHSADERYGKASVSTALCAMSDALFRMAAEAQPGTTLAVAAPCSVPDPCVDGDLCDRHETEQAHAEGEHELCGVTCETEFPTEALRNFVLAKGYPGVAGALDELLRRAAAPAERLRAERDELTKRVAELDRSETQLIGERDHMHDVADQLAYAIAPIEVIGEHSSENDPWQNALDHVTPAARPQVVSHTYEGDGGPCRAEAYSEVCGAPRADHQLDEGTVAAEGSAR